MTTASGETAPSTFDRFAPPVVLLALMWVVELADAVLPGFFTAFGLRSWDPAGLGGIVAGPLLHARWLHFIANSVPFLVLGCFVAAEGARHFWTVTLFAVVVVGTWLVNAPGTVIVGASGLVFGYFGYLVARVFAPGRVSRRLLYAVIALVVVGLYGRSMFTGVFGAPTGISWQGHLFGAVGGLLAALTGRRGDRVP